MEWAGCKDEKNVKTELPVTGFNIGREIVHRLKFIIFVFIFLPTNTLLSLYMMSVGVGRDGKNA